MSARPCGAAVALLPVPLSDEVPCLSRAKDVGQMMPVRLRCLRAIVAGMLGVMAGAIAAFGGAAAAEIQTQPWPSRVQAVYAVSFAGLNIGTFEFNSVVTGTGYHLTGRAHLSALLGAFEWQGNTRAQGMLASGMPRPNSYAFDFRSNTKAGQIKMSFADNKVTGVLAQPPMPTSASAVPLKDSHLQDVLDPLSAIMALAGAQGGRARGVNACGRRLSVFDGKQRFDLVMSYKGQSKVSEAQPSGQPNIVYVCRVRYVPLAGHVANEESKAMAQELGIEIWLRPVPNAGLLVPYQVVIPTAMGPATLTSQKVEITTQGQGQIAFIY